MRRVSKMLLTILQPILRPSVLWRDQSVPLHLFVLLDQDVTQCNTAHNNEQTETRADPHALRVIWCFRLWEYYVYVRTWIGITWADRQPFVSDTCLNLPMGDRPRVWERLTIGPKQWPKLPNGSKNRHSTSPFRLCCVNVRHPGQSE